MNVRRGLGRGLGALIPPAPPTGSEAEAPVEGGRAEDLHTTDGGPETAGLDPEPAETEPTGNGSASAVASEVASGGEVPGAHFAELPVEAIQPNPRQPRQAFDEEALAELVHSIKEVGLLQPIVVRDLGGEQYELVMGERRWRASREAELERVPAIVRKTADEAMLRDALLENLHRVELNPLEEAAAYDQLLEDFGCTHGELAQRIGRSRPQITNTLRLMKLSAAVQRRVGAGVLSAGHARALLGVTDEPTQDRLAQRTIAEGLSVRALEELVAVSGEETEGEDEASSPTRRRPKPVSPRLSELGDRLSERFETRVKVELGKNRGKITVEFASLDDLERIVTLMDRKDS